MKLVILRGQRQRDFAKQLIDEAGADFVVQISEPKRTLSQNSLMWQLLTEISKAKPHGREATPDSWKILFLHACGHACQFEIGLNGSPFPVGFRSSQLSKEQMSDLIEYIRAYAAEAGLELKG